MTILSVGVSVAMSPRYWTDRQHRATVLRESLRILDELKECSNEERAGILVSKAAEVSSEDYGADVLAYIRWLRQWCGYETVPDQVAV